MPDVNLPVRRGNTLFVHFDFEDDPGEPTDLTGATVVFSATTGDNSTRIDLNTDDDDELAIATPTSGRVTLTLTPEQTRAFKKGLINRYELEYRPAEGGQYTVQEGFLIVDEGINSDG